MTERKGAARVRNRGGRLGVWLVGARGGLATTLIAGTTAIAKGLASETGILSGTELAEGIDLTPLDRILFGGHETREQGLVAAAAEINGESGAIPDPVLRAIKPKLRAIDREIRPGRLTGAGAAIARLCAGPGLRDRMGPRRAIDILRDDMVDFMRRKRLRRMVVVNLASTEPFSRQHACLGGLAALRRALGSRRPPRLTPATLYAVAALEAGCAYINFTPSRGASAPALLELARERGLPIMGSDGKTGETLVKSALAPMFKYRHLKVLSWQGYNILGDRDGAVLADRRNKESKVATKDSLLPGILGYPLHTHVGIDYVPSLGDLKTAWDFIHFQGFLDYRMSMQFSWHGCDAILAAPLVLDLARFAGLALRRGEAGLMPWLAIYFKRPLGAAQEDLHRQWHALTAYLERVRR